MKTWKTLKVSQALNRLLKVLIIAINARRAKPLCRRPLVAPSSPLCVILLYKKFLVSNSEYWDTVFVGLGKVQSDGVEDANYHILLRTLFRSKNEG